MVQGERSSLALGTQVHKSMRRPMLNYQQECIDDCSGLCDGRAVLDADMMPGDYILVVGGARGSCQCSGVTNTIGEGDDCHDFDLGIGAWCYTAPGACDDGQPSADFSPAKLLTLVVLLHDMS